MSENIPAQPAMERSLPEPLLNYLYPVEIQRTGDIEIAVCSECRMLQFLMMICVISNPAMLQAPPNSTIIQHNQFVVSARGMESHVMFQIWC
jgi:hypothetical protein